MFAQERDESPSQSKPGSDKSDGEEEEIEQRLLWFERTRSLNSTKDPAQKRKAAAEQVKDMRRREAARTFRAAWSELGPSPMNMLSWTMGRVSGRVTALSVHPSNSEILYLATAGGGLWKTTNGGTSWVCLSNDLGTQSIGSVFVDPTTPETIWVGTGEHASSCTGYFGQGIFKSTDGGATLVPMNGGTGHELDLSFIGSIVYHPSDDQVILAGGFGFCTEAGSRLVGGAFRSTDGGLNWDKVLTGELGDIISDPNDPDVFYASIGRSSRSENGVYKSTDAGASWTRLENGIDTGTNITRLRITMAPSDPNTLYAYTSGGKVFKTTNAGTAWTQTGSNACEGQCTYNLCLAVSPVTASTLLIGSIRFALSTDSGASKTFLTSGWGSAQKVHQDTHVLVYDRTDPNKFWVGSDGGLWRTDNGGTSYTNLNGNLNITTFYDIAINPADTNRMFGGAQDNSSLGTDNNLVWDVNEVTGDGFMNLVDPVDPDVVIQTSYPSGNLPNLYRSTTGGGPNSFNWAGQTGLTSGPFPWVTPLATTTNSAKTQSYMFVGSNRVFMSTDHVSTWSAVSGALESGSLSIIEPLPSGNNLVIYAGSESGGIYRTDNALAGTPSWSTVTGNYPGGTVTDIAADRSNPMRVFVTRGGFAESQLYRSTTGGTTWTAVGSGIPNVPANAVAIDPIDSNRIFVGSDVGVFESTDGGDTFQSMMLGFPLGTVVTDLEINEEPHILVAGTYGRGAWRLDLALGDLLVEASPDQELCLGTSVSVAAVVSNGPSPLTYQWSISSGPDTSLNQFDNATSAKPSFTPSLEGEYLLVCQVTDNLSRVATDSTSVLASTEAGYTTGQRESWTENDTSSDWEVRYDRNDNGLVEVLDLIYQINTPRCF